MANYQVIVTGPEFDNYMAREARVSVSNPSSEIITIGAGDVGNWLPINVPIASAFANLFALNPPGADDANVEYTGTPGIILKMDGDAHVQRDSGIAANITFGLFKKEPLGSWTNLPEFESQMTIDNQDRVESFGTNGFIDCSTGDKFSIRVKADAAIGLELIKVKVSFVMVGFNR